MFRDQTGRRRRDMGRRRERLSGMGLLPRMEAIVGKTVTSYRYHPVQGKPIPLGRDRQEAIRRVLDLEGKAPDAGSLRWVWDKYRVSPRFVRLAPPPGGLRAVLGRDRPDSGQVPDWLVAVDRHRPLHARGACRGPVAGQPREGASVESVLPRHRSGPVHRQPGPAGSAERRGAAHGGAPAGAAGDIRRVGYAADPQRRIVALAARYASLGGSRKVEFLDLAWPQVDREAGQIRTKRAKQRGRKRGEVIDVVRSARLWSGPRRTGGHAASRLPVRLPDPGRQRLHRERLQDPVAPPHDGGHGRRRSDAGPAVHLPRPARVLCHRT